jgi:pyruvate/2-oxoglutarate dehydrogenase complex dihydrolipoamide acyltransferase (E2) component
LLYKLAVPGPIEDVYEIRVLEWHGSENHAFAPGDMMVEVETHKAVIEIRAAQAGILRTILCREGEWRKLGEPLALLSSKADEQLPTALDDLAAWEAVFQIT